MLSGLCSKSDSKDIVLLRCYRYSCSVDFLILVELEKLLLYTIYFNDKYNDNYTMST